MASMPDNAINVLRTRRFRWMLVGLAFALVLTLVRITIGNCDPVCFIDLGARFAYPDHRLPLAGFDGQFSYYIAADPWGAYPHLDTPTYRYQRILYPLAARLVAFGNVQWLPITLILVNILALGLGTSAFATLLEHEGAPSWAPLLFLAWFGVAQSLLSDLNELTALAFSLWALVFCIREKYVYAGILFGLGALAKEMTFLFSMPVLAFLVYLRACDKAAKFGSLALLPYLAWALILRALLEEWVFQAQSAQLETIPFAGLADAGPLIPYVVLLVIVPGALCVVLALRNLNHIYSLVVLLSFVFMLFLPPNSYFGNSVFRLNTPLVLAGALMLAQLHRKILLMLSCAIWSCTIAFTLVYLMPRG